MAELSVPQVDFGILGNLRSTYEDARKDAVRQRTLANLGQGGAADYAGAASNLAAGGDLQGAMSLAAIGKAFAPENTPDIQNYKFAVANGYKGSPLDFMKEKAAAGSTRITNAPVTNIAAGEKEYDKALNKDLAEVFLGYQKNGRNASGALNTLGYLENLTKSPDFYSGTGGEMVTKGKQALASMGITAPDSAKPNEVFGALSNKLTLDAAGGSLGAQISNSDVKFLQAINPNLAATPEGNREIIGYHRKVYQRQQEVAKMARDYAAKNNGRIDAGFDAKLADYAEKNPLFPQGSTQSAPTSAPQPSRAQQPQAAPRQAPDGNFYVPDPNRPGKYLKVVQ